MLNWFKGINQNLYNITPFYKGMKQEMAELEFIPKRFDEKYPHIESGYGGNYFTRKMIKMFKTPSKVYISETCNVADTDLYYRIRTIAIIWNELPIKVRHIIKRLKISENNTGINGCYNRFTNTLTVDPLGYDTFGELYRVVQHEVGHCIDFAGSLKISNDIAEDVLDIEAMTEHIQIHNLINSYGERHNLSGLINPRWRYELFAETYAVWIRERNGIDMPDLLDKSKYDIMKKVLEPRFLEVYS